jgi:chromosome segregation ATPase
MGQAFLSHVDELQAKIRRTERERDEYQAQVHTLTERVSAMTSAASSAAASTVTAIERIQEMEKVLKAAEAWVMGGSHAALVEAVQVWKKYKGSWS